jgi:hypothetical protein
LIQVLSFGLWPPETCHRRTGQLRRPSGLLCRSTLVPAATERGRQPVNVGHSIDATKIPSHLQGFRTLFSSFHYLNPDEARRLLQDTVNTRQGIGIFAATACHMFTLLSVFFVPVAAWPFLPFRRPFRWSRLLWTYLIPVIPFVLFFDGLISCLRSYSLGELQEMTSGLAASGYRWEIGELTGRLLPVRITYVIGCPQDISIKSAE